MAIPSSPAHSANLTANENRTAAAQSRLPMANPTIMSPTKPLMPPFIAHKIPKIHALAQHQFFISFVTVQAVKKTPLSVSFENFILCRY